MGAARQFEHASSQTQHAAGCHSRHVHANALNRRPVGPAETQEARARLVVNDDGHDAEEGQRGRARALRPGARQRRDHHRARLRAGAAARGRDAAARPGLRWLCMPELPLPAALGLTIGPANSTAEPGMACRAAWRSQSGCTPQADALGAEAGGEGARRTSVCHQVSTMGHRFSPTTYPRAGHARLSALARSKVPQAGRTSGAQPHSHATLGRSRESSGNTGSVDSMLRHHACHRALSWGRREGASLNARNFSEETTGMLVHCTRPIPKAPLPCSRAAGQAGARLKQPLPRAWVDRLAHAAEHAQRGPVVLLNPLVALAQAGHLVRRAQPPLHGGWVHCAAARQGCRSASRTRGSLAAQQASCQRNRAAASAHACTQGPDAPAGRCGEARTLASSARMSVGAV